MEVRDRIRKHRQAKGLTEAELARESGISLSNFHDLESYDDEWRTAISINELERLAVALDVSILDLVTDNNTKDVEPSDYENLALHITSWMQSGGTKEDLSWEIDGILQDPNRTGEMPIDFLIDMGNEIGFDWRSYLIF